MNTEKTIGILNDLIIINNDRIEGYETAAAETYEPDLKLLFARMQQTSRRCREILVKEVQELGGIPDEGTRITGKLFRVWMDMKAALTGKDRSMILDSCVFGEDAAADTYIEAVTDDIENLNPVHKSMLYSQQLMLKADQEEVKGMWKLSAQD